MSTELLKKVYLFKELSIGELVEVLKICRKEHAPKDKTVFKEGDSGDRCYIIEEGAVRISKHIHGAGEEALAVLRTGNYFGEMALIDGSPRSATAITHEDSDFLVIDKVELDQLLAENKELGNKILMVFCRTLSQRLREANEKMSHFLAMASGFGGPTG